MLCMMIEEEERRGTFATTTAIIIKRHLHFATSGLSGYQKSETAGG